MDPNSKPEFDPMSGGTKMEFFQCPWYKGPLSIYRHPLMFAANSKTSTVFEIIAAHFFLFWLFNDTENALMTIIYNFCYEHLPFDLHYLIYVFFYYLGYACFWLCLYFLIAWVLGKVFGIGRFPYSKEYYDEYYRRWNSQNNNINRPNDYERHDEYGSGCFPQQPFDPQPTSYDHSYMPHEPEGEHKEEDK